jgi:hypothetical protein
MGHTLETERLRATVRPAMAHLSGTALLPVTALLRVTALSRAMAL